MSKQVHTKDHRACAPQCRAEARVRAAAWYNDHKDDPEYVAARNARVGERREALRQFVNWIKESIPCADCGGFFPAVAMDFDHVRAEKADNIAVLVGIPAALERVQEEMMKCELVCANCHRMRTWL